jgi:UDP-N-acetylglucosamine 4,6-dehydratase
MNYLNFYNGKEVLITGGTGTIGSTTAKILSRETSAKITVVSRDETLQHELSKESPNIKFVVGDVCDKQKMIEVVKNKHVVIHTAAMKHVPTCEKNVFEAVKTNIIGAQNIREACILNGTPNIVVCSTDKAASPVGTMGMTKSIQEKIFLQSEMFDTSVSITRFGNVIGSRGSVVWTFKEKVGRGEAIPITDVNMLRYVMTPRQAAETILWSGFVGYDKCIITRQMPSCYVLDIAKAIGGDDYPIEIVGIRPGEKIEEVLFDSDSELFHDILLAEIGYVGIISMDQDRCCYRSSKEDVNDLFGLKREILSVKQIKEILINIGVL